MQLKPTENIMRNPIGWLSLLNIFIALFFLTGCSDPSHPTAIKILKEIENELSLKGQVNLSSISEQFDEMCVFRQDDSDESYTIMDMQKTLEKKNITLYKKDDLSLGNPENIILFIKGNTAIASFDRTIRYSNARVYILFDGYEEKYSFCRNWNKATIVNNGKFIELR